MNIQTVVNEYATKYPDLDKFFNEFIESFPTEDEYKDRIWDYVDLDDLDEDEEVEDLEIGNSTDRELRTNKILTFCPAALKNVRKNKWLKDPSSKVDDFDKKMLLDVAGYLNIDTEDMKKNAIRALVKKLLVDCKEFAKENL